MLTIEQLKALQVGEWVWISEPKTFFGDLSSYYTKSEASNDECFAYDIPTEDAYDEKETLTWEYDEYGKTWFAYRNKEEAEGKSITLPYLLCTSSKFACVIWQDKEGKVHKTYTMPIDEAKGVLKEKERICHTNE